MPQFAVLLYSPAPADMMDMPPEELAGHEAFSEKVEELGGTILDPQALQPSTTAKAIRGSVVTDGPYIEAKEVLSGFFVLDARDLDHAVEIARLNPSTIRGGIEIRPLFPPPED